MAIEGGQEGLNYSILLVEHKDAICYGISLLLDLFGRFCLNRGLLMLFLAELFESLGGLSPKLMHSPVHHLL